MKKGINEFYDLEVWQKAHQLVIKIYIVTRDFPNEEIFGITNQLRRAASSVVANIAEGFERYYFKDKIRFYYQARGSIAEVQTFLLLARDLGYINANICNKFNEDTVTARKLLNGLIRSVGKK